MHDLMVSFQAFKFKERALFFPGEKYEYLQKQRFVIGSPKLYSLRKFSFSRLFRSRIKDLVWTFHQVLNQSNERDSRVFVV